GYAVVSRMRGRVGGVFHSFAEGMTMTGRIWATATAGVLLLAGTQFARGDGDTYRLGGAADDAVITRLSWDGQAETTLTRGHHGGFGHHASFHHSFHHHSFHHHSFHHHSYFRGYGYGFSYYRPYYSYAYYRPFY